MLMIQPDSTGPVPVIAQQKVGAPPDALARDAIGAVLRRLSGLPPSPEVEELRLRAEDYLQQAQDWHQSRRTSEEWDALMVRVLGLYVASAQRERGSTAYARALC